MKNLAILSLSTCAAVGLTMGLITSPAQAIVFDFGDTNLEFNDPDEPTIGTVTSTGITATLTNYNSTDGFFLEDGQGIQLGPKDQFLGDSFNIAFSSQINLIAFYVSSAGDSSATLSLYRNNLSTLVATGNFGTAGRQVFNFETGQNGIFGTSDTAIIVGTFNQNDKTNTISGVEAVPFESDVLPLLGATALFGGGVWLKRRRAVKVEGLPMGDKED